MPSSLAPSLREPGDPVNVTRSLLSSGTNVNGPAVAPSPAVGDHRRKHDDARRRHSAST
jgi:hypothetical protein